MATGSFHTPVIWLADDEEWESTPPHMKICAWTLSLSVVFLFIYPHWKKDNQTCENLESPYSNIWTTRVMRKPTTHKSSLNYDSAEGFAVAFLTCSLLKCIIIVCCFEIVSKKVQLKLLLLVLASERFTYISLVSAGAFPLSTENRNPVIVRRTFCFRNGNTTLSIGCRRAPRIETIRELHPCTTDQVDSMTQNNVFVS